MASHPPKHAAESGLEQRAAESQSFPSAVNAAALLCTSGQVSRMPLN